MPTKTHASTIAARPNRTKRASPVAANEVHLIGRLSAPPTVKHLPSGAEVVQLRVVVDRPATAQLRAGSTAGGRAPTRASEPAVVAFEPWQSLQNIVCVPTALVVPAVFFHGASQGILVDRMLRRPMSRPVLFITGCHERWLAVLKLLPAPHPANGGGRPRLGRVLRG